MMARARRSAGVWAFLILSAASRSLALPQSLAGALQCDPRLTTVQCGKGSVSEDECQASGCCYSADSTGAADACYQPNAVERPGLFAIVALNSTRAHLGTASYEEECWDWGFGVPTTGPTSRNDSVGIGWQQFNAILTQEVATAEQGDGLDLVFYGDSITELWRGTNEGAPLHLPSRAIDPSSLAMKNLFKKYFGEYKSDVLAIGGLKAHACRVGDQIGNLWWRLLHGQLPSVKPPKVVMVLIGTNDLGAITGTCPRRADTDITAAAPGIASRFLQMLQVMRGGMPGAHIIVQGILPRGNNFSDVGRGTWPNRYTPAIAMLNEAYQLIAATDPYVHYVNCGDVYYADPGDATHPPSGINNEQLRRMRPEERATVHMAAHIAQDLLVDGIHPRVAGLTLMAECLLPLVQRYMQA